MKNISLLIFSFISIQVAFCQSITPDVISSAGDFFQPNVNGPSLSWTLGETVSETFTDAGNNNILTQGFQQSNYDIVAIETFEDNLNISLYPNPTSHFLNLEWEISGSSDIIIELFDINGKLLINKTFIENIAKKQINISEYPSATYLLKVTKGDKVVKTYKISKY